MVLRKYQFSIFSFAISLKTVNYLVLFSYSSKLHCISLGWYSYLVPFVPQIVFRSATNHFLSSLLAATLSSSLSVRSPVHMSLFTVVRHNSFGLPQRWLPLGVHDNSCFGSLFFQMIRICPTCLNHWSFIFCITLSWPLLLLTPSLVMCLSHLMFSYFCRQKLSNTRSLFPIAFKPFLKLFWKSFKTSYKESTALARVVDWVSSCRGSLVV